MPLLKANAACHPFLMGLFAMDVQVCKATAAAMLCPEQTQRAVPRQAVLQPLKFAHFERRALHMASQLLECSRR